MTEALLSTLPTPRRTHLESLRNAVLAALGERLQAMTIFGSLPRGEFHPETSDIDVLLVIVGATRSALASIATALQLARNAARIECVLLDAAEVSHAADVFPLFYDDIRRHQLRLHGEDPLKGVTIEARHIRLRIEQELRESQIRLRRLVIDGGARPQVLRSAVARKLKQIRGPLAALLRLRGEPDGSDTLPAVIERACRVYSLDPAPLLRSDMAPETSFDQLLQLYAAATHDINGREDR